MSEVAEDVGCLGSIAFKALVLALRDGVATTRQFGNGNSLLISYAFASIDLV